MSHDRNLKNVLIVFLSILSCLIFHCLADSLDISSSLVKHLVPTLCETVLRDNNSNTGYCCHYPFKKDNIYRPFPTLGLVWLV